MDKEILTPLNAIETCLDTLVRSLTSTQTYAAGPKAARDLVKADDDLEEALTRLKRHQENLFELQKLRAEADSLNAKIKNTVLTCVSLRKELGEINYSILEDSDDEEEDINPVDYETLLAFATRIGKHNAVAAQEAEKLVEQQYIAAKRAQEQNKAGGGGGGSTPGMNGLYGGNITDTTTTHDEPTTTTNSSSFSTSQQQQQQAQQTQQITEQISEFQNRRNWDRAQITAPFPNAEILRIGELGRLQIQREQNGEDYSDGFVEALIRRTELKSEGSGVVSQREGSGEVDPAPAAESKPSAAEGRPVAPSVAAQQQQERRPAAPPAEGRPKKTLNLDFPDDDDDDEDEDSDGD